MNPDDLRNVIADAMLGLGAASLLVGLAYAAIALFIDHVDRRKNKNPECHR